MQRACYRKSIRGITVKKITFIFIAVILLSITFAACSQPKENDDAAIAVPEIYNRSINFGMSEEDVTTLEAELTFDTDYSRTETGTEHTIKCIESNNSVQINDAEAIISYVFLDDALVQIEYNIQVVYPKSNLIDMPAFQVYNKQVADLSEIIGLPSETSSDEYETFNSKISIWNTSDLTVSIDVMQTTETFSDDDINDDVRITMVSI